MTTQRSSTDIAADLADFRAARSALVKGERVDEVWRDGRRMIFADISLKDINTAITDLEREYDQAVNAEASRPTRSAIGVYW